MKEERGRGGNEKEDGERENILIICRTNDLPIRPAEISVTSTELSIHLPHRCSNKGNLSSLFFSFFSLLFISPLMYPFIQIYKQDGLGGFYRGIGPNLARSVPPSAFMFFLVEYLRKNLFGVHS